MMKVNRFTVAVAILLVAMLACNLPQGPAVTQDINAPLTAAAQTIAAQLTQSAPIASPTSQVVPPVVVPTNTSPAPTIQPPATIPPVITPTQQCDKAQYIADVTVPDGSIVASGDVFTKTWRIKNTGTCTWTGYSLVFDTGDAMGGVASSAIATTPPGGTVDLSVTLTAPAANGEYRGYWRIKNSTGTMIPVIGGYNNKSFYVDVKVTSGGGGPFAVTSVTYSVTTWSSPGFVDCPRVVAQITVNGAGTVTFQWTRKDSPGGGTPETVTFSAAGTKTVRYDWTRGSTWAGSPTWVGIFVVDPNNQNFGHKNFNTACTSP